MVRAAKVITLCAGDEPGDKSCNHVSYVRESMGLIHALLQNRSSHAYAPAE